MHGPSLATPEGETTQRGPAPGPVPLMLIMMMTTVTMVVMMMGRRFPDSIYKNSRSSAPAAVMLIILAEL